MSVVMSSNQLSPTSVDAAAKACQSAAEQQQVSATNIEDVAAQSHPKRSGDDSGDVSFRRIHSESIRNDTEDEGTSRERGRRDDRGGDGYCSPHAPPFRPPSPLLISRRGWTHVAERGKHAVNQPVHSLTPNCPEGAPAGPVTQGRSKSEVLHGPSMPPTPPPLSLAPISARVSLGAPSALSKEKPSSEAHVAKPVKGGQAAPSKNTRGAAVPLNVLLPSSPITPSPTPTEFSFAPQFPAHRESTRAATLSFSTSQRSQPLLAIHHLNTSVKDGTAATVRTEEEEVGEESSPSPCRTPSFTKQDDSALSMEHHFNIPPQAKTLMGVLPTLSTSSATWDDTKDEIISIPPPPTATLSLNRPRLSQNVPLRRLSPQISLSFDYAEEDKVGMSTTNSESFPQHGLSPSSAVPSEAHSFALPAATSHTDLLWRGRQPRIDLRSNSRSTSSPQRRDLDPLPPRCASTTLVDRRMPLAGDALPSQPPQRRMCNSNFSRVESVTGALLSSAETLLLPHLNLLLHSPPSMSPFPGSLTPLAFRSPTRSNGCEGQAEDLEETAQYVAWSHRNSNSSETFSPLTNMATPLALPLTHHTQSALPSIQTALVANNTATRCPMNKENGDIEEKVRMEGPVLGSTRSGSSPRTTRVSFSASSLHHTDELTDDSDVVHNSRCTSAREASVKDFTSPDPPPPPWTPAEAFHWMSGRFTRQEAQEMLQYDRVYYCGPAVPPRTACGVTEVVCERGTSEEMQASTVDTAALGPAITFDAAASTSSTLMTSTPSYFPISLGMHVSFRYEVVEVLGFGTYSVVVHAIDHAAPPLSPERHCALKLIRREVLYRQAAQEEWNVCERVRMCCDLAAVGSLDSSKREASTESPHHPPPRRPFLPNFLRSPLPTWHLSLTDQRSLLVAGVLTPRARFEFRGYHVIVFPLLGFNVRDVIELQRDNEEAAAAANRQFYSRSPHLAAPVKNLSSATELSVNSSSPPPKTSSVFPPLITASVVAQVVHALAFLHHTAHLLHGDLKPENVAFVDRTLNRGVAGSSPLHIRGYSDSETPTTAEEAGGGTLYNTPAAPSISYVPLLHPSPQEPSCLSAASLRSRSISNAAGAAPRRVSYNSRISEVDGEDLVPARAVDGKAVIGAVSLMPEEKMRIRTTQGEGGEENGEAPNRTVVTPLTRELYGGVSVVYAPRTPLRRPQGQAANHTGTLSSPYLAHQTDRVTFGDSTDGAAAASHTPLSDSLPNNASHSTQSTQNIRHTSAFLQASPQIRAPLSSSDFNASSVSAYGGTSSRVALIDLGHAKSLTPGETGTVFPLQSPSYRAPEMALRLPYTTAIDMWSLGCILYELRTGHVLFPRTCDDNTMLASAVETLGMPDSNFLAMVKVCWKAYKQRKASVSEAAHSRRDSSVALHAGTSFDVYLAGPETANTVPEAAPRDTDNTSAVPAPSGEEAAVERCWKSFIQTLNATAGQQRARADRRRQQRTSNYVSDSLSTAPSPSKRHNSAGSRETRFTTWETPEQCALLSALFPEGQADVEEHTFTLKVADCHRHPSASTSAVSTVLFPTNVDLNTAAGEEQSQQQVLPPYAWVDFLLGCLYWDAAERLSSTEAQRHPFVAAHFLSGKSEEGEEAAASRATTHEEPLSHCSGVYYLQRHPLTTGLFGMSQQRSSSSRRRRSSAGVDKQNSSQSLALQSRRSSTIVIPVLPLAVNVVLPFELPSNRRTAPSARAWEEQQQQRIVSVDIAADTTGRLTPRGQRVSVFSGRSLSLDAVQACSSATTTTTPFRVEFYHSDERASNCDADLVTPERMMEATEGEEDGNSDGPPRRPPQEKEVMVLRLE